MTKEQGNNKCTLKCSADDYADLYIEAQPLYKNYDPMYFINHMKSDTQSLKLAMISTNNPMGIPEDDLELPIPSAKWEVLVGRVKSLPAYQELSSNSDLVIALHRYLKRYGMKEDYEHHELFMIRLFSLISLLFAEYIDDCNKSDQDLVLTDDDREQALEAVMFLRNNLSKFSMGTEDEVRSLKLLLKRFGRYNNKNSRSYKPSLNKSSSTGGPNHPLRLMGIKLTVFFFSAHKSSHSTLVKTILKAACKTIGLTTVDGYVVDAKNLLVESKSLIDHLLPVEIADEDPHREFRRQQNRKDKYKQIILPDKA